MHEADDDYDEEVRQEIALCLSDTPPGCWGEIAFCPGPFGCLVETEEEARAAGVGEDFPPCCRVVRVYRAREA